MDRKTKVRAEQVRAMEIICRSINDEGILMSWLACGVADGDINYNTTLEEIDEMGYTEDDTFTDLMACFLRCMKRAYNSGGLYCGGIVSAPNKDE